MKTTEVNEVEDSIANRLNRRRKRKIVLKQKQKEESEEDPDLA